MNVKDAVVQRFRELCSERDITFNQLANLSGVTPSTVYSMRENKRRHVDLITVKILCDGLEISLPEFFDAPIFVELDQELK